MGAIALKGLKPGNEDTNFSFRSDLAHYGDWMEHEISRSKIMVAKCFKSEADFSFEKGKRI